MTMQLAGPVSSANGDGPYDEPARDLARWGGPETPHPLVDFVRQGQDTSLRSVQLWAEIARLCNPAERPDPVGVALMASTYDLFETLLVAQRRFVDQLLAAQREFALQLFAVQDQPAG